MAPDDELDRLLDELDELEGNSAVEPREVQVEDLRAHVFCCPHEGERVPCAVLICPGHPGKQFGSSHMDAPLLQAIAKELDSDGVPHVRFNYTSYEKNETTQGVELAAKADVEKILKWMLTDLCDEVSLVGYSLGSNVSLDELLSRPQDISRYVALSVGSEYWKFCQGPEYPKGFHENVRRDFERHSKLTQQSMYVCGTKDSLLNMMKLKYVLSQRKDNGAGRELKSWKAASTIWEALRTRSLLWSPAS